MRNKLLWVFLFCLAGGALFYLNRGAKRNKDDTPVALPNDSRTPLVSENENQSAEKKPQDAPIAQQGRVTSANTPTSSPLPAALMPSGPSSSTGVNNPIGFINPGRDAQAERMSQIFNLYRAHFDEVPSFVPDYEMKKHLQSKLGNEVSDLVTDKKGRIVDAAGQPLHFHFVSKREWEVRSAGQDGTMWNDDDFVLSNNTGQNPMYSKDKKQ
jgi:hypothetical protein